MKKYLLLTVFAALAIVANACKSDNEDPTPAELLFGKWINTQVSGREVLTDKAFYMQLRTDNIEVYANGYELDSANRTWMENDKYAYSYSNDTIFISGKDYSGKLFQMKFKLLSVSNIEMRYSILSFTIDGVSHPDTNTYTMARITNDFSTDFKGTWYGKCTTEGTTDTSFHYWQYLADGTYNYYYTGTDGKWKVKTDNEGKYFLYGNFFVSNYSNDLQSGGKGKAYECWNFSIANDRMTWTGLREGGKTITYQMERVANPPATE